MSYQDHCNDIANKLTLKSEDRETLKRKRGFSDEVIDKLGFKSCGTFLKNDPFIRNLPDNIIYSLTAENTVLIPYFDQDLKAIHIKAHPRNSPEGEGIRPYIPWPLLLGNDRADLSHIVLAESEFKAAASCVMGAPSIGIPGIASFSGKRFLELVEILRIIGTNKITICFDNEVKDNPAFANFKVDWRNRYDTQLWAFIMARQLEYQGFVVKIATLRDDWRQEGKIDIDGVLAAKIPASRYRDCIRNGVDAYAYKESWKFEKSHLAYLERRIDRHFYRGPISAMSNCYFVQRMKDGKPVQKKISNFVIEIIHTLYGSSYGAERYCRFVSNYGNSKAIFLTADIMASKQGFNKFCYEHGDYEFAGSEEDMKDIWKFIFIHQDGRSINKLKTYGYSDEAEAWFFNNGAYKGSEFYHADEDGIVWLKEDGFKLHDTQTGITPPELSSEKVSITLVDVFNNLSQVIGRDYAKILIGWSLGSLFMSEILQTYNIYPFLFIHGKYASGKSTIANWITSFYGINAENGIPMTSTLAGIKRLASQMSMIPVWLEEYRNKDPDIAKKNNFLRNIYDKSTIVQGTRREDEIKTYKAKCTLIISGEEYPNDAALNSRCLQIPVFNDNAGDQSPYLWLQSHKCDFSSLSHQVLINRDTLWPKIKARIDVYKHSFQSDKLKISGRNAAQMSIIGGLCDILLGETLEFSEFLNLEAVKNDSKRMQETALYVFLDDIADMASTNKINYPFIESKVVQNKKTKVDMNIVYFAFSAVYSTWETYLKGLRTDLPSGRTALSDHIAREPYYIGKKPARVGGKVLQCLLLDFDSPKFPASLRNIINQQQDMATPEIMRDYRNPDELTKMNREDYLKE